MIRNKTKYIKYIVGLDMTLPCPSEQKITSNNTPSLFNLENKMGFVVCKTPDT